MGRGSRHGCPGTLRQPTVLSEARPEGTPMSVFTWNGRPPPCRLVVVTSMLP
ncbi:hypothetical protein NSERUTF1_6425 [Nocardia seriolae]|nr:hypothetical protein NSERUTF1_6425 [Nocardia seriolae]